MRVSPKCPSCQRKLAPVEASDNPAGATRVSTRTCRHCRETWQIVARPPLAVNGLQINVMEVAFTGHRD